MSHDPTGGDGGAAGSAGGPMLWQATELRVQCTVASSRSVTRRVLAENSIESQMAVDI